MFWLAFDPVRERRLRSIGTLVASPTVVGLLSIFPDFWRDMARSMGAHMGWMFIGLIFAMTMLIVAAGMGMVHLAGHLASSFRRSTKPGGVPRTDGIWDRDLDEPDDR